VAETIITRQGEGPLIFADPQPDEPGEFGATADLPELVEVSEH
jgi:hypothetical protein